ncbi:MAG: 3-phosphoserine/phosphohydroxythreonine transaminase [Chloroflexi bacterium]|nr:3-phosphoserine/phosphohydroxythreonine transaminase [Chloroflexota bacterium]MBM3174320.1 3-phosphoserine/phosphohydroxythreonine transaminase [Chloroflexota bacterium]MBM4449451.1 3-phosphoserine/phosphohydroxythreonine transaminase [Chloroflexota bacterium]
MAKRNVNFNPGPAALPLEVLKTVQEELLDYHDSGMSILESSHRAKEFEAINDRTIALVRELLEIGTDYHVLFMGGGASTQFALIPMNFIDDGQIAAYVDTGEFASKALKECQIVAKAHVAFSSKEEKYRRLPKMSEIKYPENAAYLHLCSNNTIEGTQFWEFPDTGNVPLIADMSSDIASRRLDFNKFSLVYAGAQKNLGPAGVTLVIVRYDFLAKCKKNLPAMLSYKTHADNKSLYNTPPVFGVYVMKLVLEWIKGKGGLEGMEKLNAAKKDLLYSAIDAAPDFYRGTADKSSRSWMNVTMRLPDEDLENKFIDAAKKEGLLGIKGHRSVGGIRFSIYNAVSLEDIQKAVDFMGRFRRSA